MICFSLEILLGEIPKNWPVKSVLRSWSHARLFSNDKTQSVTEFMVIHIVEDVSEAFAQCKHTLLCVGVEPDCSSSSLKARLTNYLTSRCLRLMCIDRAECQADDAGYMRNPWLQVICRMSCMSVALFWLQISRLTCSCRLMHEPKTVFFHYESSPVI